MRDSGSNTKQYLKKGIPVEDPGKILGERTTLEKQHFLCSFKYIEYEKQQIVQNFLMRYDQFDLPRLAID